jgi:predicted AAA+ superfamily ATPase
MERDVLRRHAQLAPSAFSEGSRLFTEFKGALFENYVLQTLRMQFEVLPRYWAMDNPHREVDFLIQHENSIVPVEVTSSESVKSASFRKYREKYADKTTIAIRISQKTLRLDGGLLNIPHYLAGETRRLLELIDQEDSRQCPRQAWNGESLPCSKSLRQGVEDVLHPVFFV